MGCYKLAFLSLFSRLFSKLVLKIYIESLVDIMARNTTRCDFGLYTAHAYHVNFCQGQRWGVNDVVILIQQIYWASKVWDTNPNKSYREPLEPMRPLETIMGNLGYLKTKDCPPPSLDTRGGEGQSWVLEVDSWWLSFS